MTIDGAVTQDEFQGSLPPKKGQYSAYAVCWLLGIGCLFSWNSMLTIEDYYQYLFPDYHSSRVLTLVYQPFALITTFILAYNEARINTRQRILIGYVLFFISTFIIIILDLATSGKGGLGTFIGICAMSALFGFADAHVQAGIMGDLSYMNPDFIQSFTAGLAASGVITSGLRLITKSAFENSKDGLRKGALLFFSISTLYELFCVFLYTFIFPRLKVVNYYRSKAASEGSKTVVADLAAGGIAVSDQNDVEESKAKERLNNKELLKQNIDFGLDIFITYILTLSIFPGFLSEDTGKHGLGSWYAITLIAMFNVGDLIGRYIPLIKVLKLERRSWLTIAAISRLSFIPAFYFTAKYGDQGWMLMLCILLGLSNGFITTCVFTLAPKGYKGPEQNALGNILVVFLLMGITSGVISDWLWLIGKGW
ncbi:equilibrative nucleotide transporter 3 [Cryptomeria japonica]|uniref:equilibrative nucleotide transporter 3 n=1 Tax=Cryptomeria japonica TaxID=3369 RepID=UPI0025AC1B06|nr:equilibrative nucleotide transporter 3 [Cryptomeria japonica]XP_057820823.1 equilibrative nucleotide transporter 3 [Cryptomeria japonica]XP_057820824.1 equilibrative nucleotide transporter 3 [Cryptomeria japonica]XP_057820826.1 equilibrative nucleotide transporter 3 [Cryptomeria japonica]XP_057820827.1 equilibrative nucleotide transporter 3 [Cryptomeria japonica]XP_057820828.1 equilibrative nucleotide transporter 3 [Cryptomeria japonica]XP_057820829.1 equilibrative nucleotide transporter 3